MSMSNDTIGNRTRDLPRCNAVPQIPAPPRGSSFKHVRFYNISTSAKEVAVVISGTYAALRIFEKDDSLHAHCLLSDVMKR
jgi:hypothetical protein